MLDILPLMIEQCLLAWVVVVFKSPKASNGEA